MPGRVLEGLQGRGRGVSKHQDEGSGLSALSCAKEPPGDVPPAHRAPGLGREGLGHLGGSVGEGTIWDTSGPPLGAFSFPFQAVCARDPPWLGC